MATKQQQRAKGWRDREAVDPSVPLANWRYEAFAQLVADGSTANSAWHKAGYAKSSGNSRAYKLQAVPYVAARITWLRAQKTETDLKDREQARQWVRHELREIYAIAKRKGRLDAALRALELVGKDAGQWREMIDHNFQWDGDPAKLTEAQLQTLISRIESAWFGNDAAAIERARAEAIAELPPPTIDVTAEQVQ